MLLSSVDASNQSSIMPDSGIAAHPRICRCSTHRDRYQVLHLAIPKLCKLAEDLAEVEIPARDRREARPPPEHGGPLRRLARLVGVLALEALNQFDAGLD